VKKPREKISVEGRDNEKTNTDESDNSQESQNGSGIHTVTDNNVDIPMPVIFKHVVSPKLLKNCSGHRV
jgi:hypothetical protein